MSSHEPNDTMSEASDTPTPQAPGTTTPDAGARPGRLPRLERAGWAYALKRAVKEFWTEGGIDLAAMLTHFTALSLAPVLLAIFSVVSLILTSNAETVPSLVEELTTQYVPVDYQGLVADVVNMITRSAGGSGTVLVIAIGTGVWASYGYVTAFSRCMNTIYCREEGRGLLRHTGTMLLVALAMLAGVVLILVSLALDRTIVAGLLGPIAEPLGLGALLDFLLRTFLPVWAWLKWLVILALVSTLIALLYHFTPDVRRPRLTWISAGSVVAILGIAITGVLSWSYLARLAGYSLYGAVAVAIALVFALWGINTVLLLGGKVDAEVERARELQAGIEAEENIDLPPWNTAEAGKAKQSRDRLKAAGRELRLSHTEDTSIDGSQ